MVGFPQREDVGLLAGVEQLYVVNVYEVVKWIDLVLVFEARCRLIW